MIQLGILEKVTHGRSDWVSSIVTIKKTDGDIRISGGYKVSINHQTYLDLFPLPSIETSGYKLANMKYFMKTNLKSAYNQIEIDNKFKEITTLNTLMRLLRWCHLPFGIKTAGHIFQSHWENLKKNGQDDNISRQYMPRSPHQKELKSKTEQVLQNLKRTGMTINRDICKLDSEKLSYQGYQYLEK